MWAYGRLMHEVFIGYVEKRRIVPGFVRSCLPGDLIFRVTALTLELEGLDPIVHSGEVLSQH
jgi:hypothetical protein